MSPRAVVVSFAFMGLLGCKPELPELQTTGRYVLWGADPSSSVACAALAARADVYIERVHEELGLPLPNGVIAHYYYDPDGRLTPPCDDLQGCTVTPGHRWNRSGDVIEIYAKDPLMYHELAHAIHFWHFKPPAHPLLSEGFAELLDSGDGASSWRAWNGLSKPFVDLVKSEDFEGKDALLLADATLSRHGPERFVEFFEAAVDATDAAEFDAIHEAVTGETWSAAVAAHGLDGCDLQLALCSSAVLEPEDGVWTIETPASCDDADGLIGPIDHDPPIVELRATIEIPADGSYLITKDVDIEFLLVPCDMPCGPARDETLVLASFETWDPELHSGRWEMVARFFVDGPPGRVELSAL